MLLITTCRKPCTNTRLFARSLNRLVPDSEYTPRGKKNIYELIELARQKGLRRICIVSDFKGNPGELEFIKLDKKNWEWADEIFKIRSAKFEKERNAAGALGVDGALKDIMIDLLDINESEEPDIILTANEKEMKFGDKMHIKYDVYKNSGE